MSEQRIQPVATIDCPFEVQPYPTWLTGTTEVTRWAVRDARTGKLTVPRGSEDEATFLCARMNEKYRDWMFMRAMAGGARI